MGMQNFFVLTAAQRMTAMSYNGGEVAINPRAIDNTSPGVGINLNDNADGYDPGDVVPLSLDENSDPAFVAPKRIVDDPEYLTYASGTVSFLLTLPWCTLETETIFAPDPPI